MLIDAFLWWTGAFVWIVIPVTFIGLVLWAALKACAVSIDVHCWFYAMAKDKKSFFGLWIFKSLAQMWWAHLGREDGSDSYHSSDGHWKGFRKWTVEGSEGF